MGKRVIIIGSGLAGVNAAYPLVTAGVSVTMLDVGTEAKNHTDEKELTFDERRRTDPAQYKLFLGEDFSALQSAFGEAGHAGAMTSGRREHVTRSTDALLPVESGGTVVTQSLAQGGLSEAWGGVCAFFEEDELTEAGLPSDLSASYSAVIERTGVSGPEGTYALQPPAHLDTNSALVLQKESAIKNLNRRGLTLEQPALALLTEAKDGRRATTYRDMDFWDDAEGAVYRARYTLAQLRQHENFTYVPHTLVTRVEENSTVRVVGLDTRTNTEVVHEADVVIVAAGALNSTRILLQSFNLLDTPVPILMKDNYIAACLIPRALGKPHNPRRHSLCQLTLEDKTTNAYAQFYSYRSLLLYKLLRYVPLPAPQALRVLAAVVPAMMLVDVRFPSALDMQHHCTLRKDGANSYLEIVYPDIVDQGERARGLRRIKRGLRMLGLLPLHTAHNPYGATSHYAGGVPFSDSADEFPLSVDAHGRLHKAKNIFVADSATWRALPAKPPGLTIMANADRTGSYVRDIL